MKSSRNVRTLLLILGAVLPIFAASTNISRPTITLRIVNEADVDQRAISRAVAEAAAILSRSGVDLVWLSCEAGWADATSRNPCRQ
jgi:hypothetical protein